MISRSKSIKAKILLLYGGILILVVLLSNALFYYYSQTYFYEHNVNSLKSIARDVIFDDIVGKELKEGLNFLNHKYEFSISNVYIQVLYDGKIVLKSRNIENFKLPKPDSQLVNESIVHLNLKEFPKYALILYSTRILNNPKYIVQVAVTNQEAKESLNKIRNKFLIGDPIFLAIVLMILYRMLVAILKPMDTMIDTAREISISDLDKRVSYEDKGDEFSKLARTLNNMLERLQSSFKQIKRFSSDASHQLKTPLAAMRVQTDVALKMDREVDEYKTVLRSINSEIIHLQNMINNLFLLTKMDDEIIQKNFKNVELDIVLMNVVEEFVVLASQKGVILDMKELEHTTIKGEDSLVSILCSNLIDNAIKYTTKGKKVTVSLKDKTITIKDEGIGIEEENVKAIYDRFFRVQSSRFNGANGYGLGMSIVKKIANLHGAKTEIQSKINFGTTIKVSFAT
jgi:signal transduction histidine kinase